VFNRIYEEAFEVVDIRLKTSFITLVNGVYEETYICKTPSVSLSLHFLQEEIFEVVDIRLETTFSLPSNACPNCPISVDNTSSLYVSFSSTSPVYRISCVLSPKDWKNSSQCKQSYLTAE